MLYRPTPAELDRLSAQDHVHIGWLQGTDEVCAALRGSRATLSRDTAVNAQGGIVDVAFGSVRETPALALTERDRLLAEGHHLAIITRGATGRLVTDGKDTWKMRVENVDVVDTTGAGNTFAAYFLACWKLNGDVPQALSHASKAAAQTCMYFGGFP